MEQLQHFSHEHLLSLIQLQPDYDNENFEREDEDEDDVVVEERHVGKCKMCKEEIYSFHLRYYSCKDCDYSLHTFCAQLPTTQQNHPLHPGHFLTLSEGFQFHETDFKNLANADSVWKCLVCNVHRQHFYNYHCSICKFSMDIICATLCHQKMDHPSHPHQLQRYFSPMTSVCNACGNEHSGTFYHCTTCSYFTIHLDCALLPAKLLIQQSTNGVFSHSHALTLAYSYPYIELKARYFPYCRVCDGRFLLQKSYYWHYRCDKCRYYAHVYCAAPAGGELSSVLTSAGLKNFKDDDYPNLIRCPFPDESFNLLKHIFINKGELIIKRETDGERFSHQHHLILFDTHNNNSVSLHDPMKRVELFCDGCVRPITDMPFYKCSKDDCGFVLHEWCTRLPSELQDHYAHPDHTLVLLPKAPTHSLGLFSCKICELICNGFAYGCKQCEYYVDINCCFIPDAITHEAHPNHLFLRFKASGNQEEWFCKACRLLTKKLFGFHCSTCDIYLHTECALLLPRTIRHKYDKHPLSLRYYPAENHIGEYFCDICEDEFDPIEWFYHCSTCSSSMHTACAPVKLQCEQSTYSKFRFSIFEFCNVKFGGRYKIGDHPHPVTFVQGVNNDGQCIVCDGQLQCHLILKCFECRIACHYYCARVISALVALP